MKHYDQVEWSLYKNNLLDEKIYEAMEEHLYECDQCLDTFLSLIDENEIEEAGKIVSEGFTDNLMINMAAKSSPSRASECSTPRKKYSSSSVMPS